jgi:putative transcription antitermination factor YqgF
MRILALDYGRARTGVAISDPTGTLARPLAVVRRVRSKAGMQELLQLVDEHEPERIVVGLPLTLRGEEGEQARETRLFVSELAGHCSLPVETYDERFTTALAGRSAGGRSGEDAVAAAHLLEGYLRRLLG